MLVNNGRNQDDVILWIQPTFELNNKHMHAHDNVYKGAQPTVWKGTTKLNLIYS